LQDTIVPVPAASIVQIVEHELGAPLATLFQSFDCEPLATASMAQVHRAVLPDGAEVVVKVQRPQVRKRIEVDLAVLGEMARFASRHTTFGARFDLPQMVRELEQSLRQELDFRQEADNTRLIGRQIADFSLLATPTVYDKYTTERVLTLGFVRGRHLDVRPTPVSAGRSTIGKTASSLVKPQWGHSRRWSWPRPGVELVTHTNSDAGRLTPQSGHWR
jgi:ubiquinone biosynthesis protein